MITITIAIYALLTGCKKEVLDCCATPIASIGNEKWEWVKTVTPSRTDTPASTGVFKEINLFVKDSKSYMTYYENDKLVNKYVIDNDFYVEDKVAYWFANRFDKKQYVKFYLFKGNYNYVDRFELTAFSDTYPLKVDTVRHTYQRVGQLANTALE